MAVIYAHFCDEMQLASALCFHSWGYITLGLFYLPVEMQTICLHSIYNHPLPSCMFMKHGAFMDSVSEALQGTATVSADSLHDPDGKNRIWWVLHTVATWRGSVTGAVQISSLHATAYAGKHVTITCLRSLSSWQRADVIYMANPSPQRTTNGVSEGKEPNHWWW